MRGRQQIRIAERRDHGEIDVAEAERQQIDGDADKDRGDEQLQQVAGGEHQPVLGQRERNPAQRDRRGAPERDDEDGHGPSDLTGLDFADRRSEGGRGADQRPDVEFGWNRLDDEEGAEEADADRQPPPPAHHLAIEHDR